MTDAAEFNAIMSDVGYAFVKSYHIGICSNHPMREKLDIDRRSGKNIIKGVGER